MALGPYPQVSLLDARTKRDEVKVKIRSGVDPAAEKRLTETAEPLPGDTGRFMDQKADPKPFKGVRREPPKSK